LLAVEFVLPGPVAWSAEPFVYPEKGQSKGQQEKDKCACYQCAKSRAGFDTTNPAPPLAGV
jgi:hypothetical protein